ncbi:MAG: DUF3127 domain-containing protein [Bacteroidales bacterium]
MQLTARLINVLPVQTGQGKNGPWKKQDIIVETDGQYPKKVCIAIWGDKVNESVLVVGTILTISFDVESREFNGKWYTDVKAWRVEVGAGAPEGGSASYTANSAAQLPNSPVSAPNADSFDAMSSAQEGDDLPF